MSGSHCWTFPMRHLLVPKTFLLCAMEDRGSEAVRSRALATSKAGGPLSDLDDMLVSAPSSGTSAGCFKLHISQRLHSSERLENGLARHRDLMLLPNVTLGAGNVRRGRLDGRNDSHSSTSSEVHLVLSFNFLQLNTAYRYTSKYCGLQYRFPYHLANRVATTATPFSRHRSFVT
jgi:hypothetical protein